MGIFSPFYIFHLFYIFLKRLFFRMLNFRHIMDKMCGRLRLKYDGTRAETRFRLTAKWKSPFKSTGASVQSTTSSRGLRISGSNAGYTIFRGSVKSTDYPLHSPVSTSLSLPCVTVCHHISTGLYQYKKDHTIYCVIQYIPHSFLRIKNPSLKPETVL